MICCSLQRKRTQALLFLPLHPPPGTKDRRVENHDPEGCPGRAPLAPAVPAAVPPGACPQPGGGRTLAAATGEHHRHLLGGGQRSSTRLRRRLLYGGIPGPVELCFLDLSSVKTVRSAHLKSCLVFFFWFLIRAEKGKFSTEPRKGVACCKHLVCYC